MTAKEFLLRVKDIDAEIEIKASELERPWSRATKTTTQLSDDPTQTSFIPFNYPTFSFTLTNYINILHIRISYHVLHNG